MLPYIGESIEKENGMGFKVNGWFKFWILTSFVARGLGLPGGLGLGGQGTLGVCYRGLVLEHLCKTPQIPELRVPFTKRLFTI